MNNTSAFYPLTFSKATRKKYPPTCLGRSLSGLVLSEAEVAEANTRAAGFGSAQPAEIIFCTLPKLKAAITHSYLALVAAVSITAFSPTLQAHVDVNCDIVIVGAGAGGVHTAYQLIKSEQWKTAKICLIEKENRLGGRIYDVALDPKRPGQVYGLGALRVVETQNYLFKLADDLAIDLQPMPYQDDLVSARGYIDFNSDNINKKAYPRVPDSLIDGGFGTETALYDKLRFGPKRKNVQNYPDFRSYVRDVVGTQGYHFLTDVFRFRADFEATLSARGYLDYFDEEWDVCCLPYYPVGGMSQFILRMADQAQANGVKVYLEEPVLSIAKVAGVRPYKLVTTLHNFYGKRVVIAAPKQGLQYIGGGIAGAIKSQQQFKDLLGIKVVTIAQKWPNAWWENAGYPGKNVRRAWTTEHCLNALEVPVNDYAAKQWVTRSVYDDDIRCVDFWENTAKLGIAEVEKEIDRGLRYLFPNATIPKPLNTVVQVWPAAWYWLKGGSQFTNAEIAQWAIEPIPGEKIALVGESYNPQRSGWSDGAYKSSINVLNAQYGLNIDSNPAAPLAAEAKQIRARQFVAIGVGQPIETLQ